MNDNDFTERFIDLGQHANVPCPWNDDPSSADIIDRVKKLSDSLRPRLKTTAKAITFRKDLESEILAGTIRERVISPASIALFFHPSQREDAILFEDLSLFERWKAIDVGDWTQQLSDTTILNIMSQMSDAAISNILKFCSIEMSPPEPMPIRPYRYTDFL